MRREQSRDSERDKSEVEHGGHSLRAGRTAARLRLNRYHVDSMGTEDYVSQNKTVHEWLNLVEVGNIPGQQER